MLFPQRVTALACSLCAIGSQNKYLAHTAAVLEQASDDLFGVGAVCSCLLSLLALAGVFARACPVH